MQSGTHDYSLNSESFAKVSFILGYRVYRDSVLAGEWGATLKCGARAGGDTGRWAV